MTGFLKTLCSHLSLNVLLIARFHLEDFEKAERASANGCKAGQELKSFGCAAGCCSPCC